MKTLKDNTERSNPLFSEFNTVHGTAPFGDIKFEDFEPAFLRGIELSEAEIEKICSDPAVPDFNNVLRKLEWSGRELQRVENVFFPLVSALCDEKIMDLSIKVSQMLSEHGSRVLMNRRLWEKIRHVYEHRDEFDLDSEDRMLLKETYESFALNGALLEGDARQRAVEIRRELSELGTRFGQNVLKELNGYEIWLTEEELSGLPENVVEEASAAASEKGHEGEYLFTLAMPTYMAVMKYADSVEVRKRFYSLYSKRNTQGEFSNAEVVRRIVNLRLELARLLGYRNYSEYSLVRTMAHKPENVYSLLDRLREAYGDAARQEVKEIEKFAHEKFGYTGSLRPWDYSYFANKLKKERYDSDDERLRPYFELENTVKGVFGLATSLYGLTFREVKDIQVYHPDVKAFEVLDADGTYIGMIYTDFFPRSTKRPGAWMTEFKEQWREPDGTDSRPHVTIVMNFTKPTATRPSLLSPSEVTTFLHEFGHALHGLLSRTKYASLSGTNVYRDFVELPSQFNENFFTQREFLKGFAVHYQTGELIPQEEIDKIVASQRFGAAYACMRQLSFGYLDMAWHTMENPFDGNVGEFERKAMESTCVVSVPPEAVMSTSFGHIFGGGYASGYYSYKWSEVLDADAFALFKEKGVMDKESARRFRENILEKGGTEEPDILYRNFRGRDASVEALMERDGIGGRR